MMIQRSDVVMVLIIGNTDGFISTARGQPLSLCAQRCISVVFENYQKKRQGQHGCTWIRRKGNGKDWFCGMYMVKRSFQCVHVVTVPCSQLSPKKIPCYLHCSFTPATAVPGPPAAYDVSQYCVALPTAARGAPLKCSLAAHSFANPLRKSSRHLHHQVISLMPSAARTASTFPLPGQQERPCSHAHAAIAAQNQIFYPYY